MFYDYEETNCTYVQTQVHSANFWKVLGLSTVFMVVGWQVLVERDIRQWIFVVIFSLEITLLALKGFSLEA